MEVDHLLDACVLIALADKLHTAHRAANSWFDKTREGRFATCPITQMALLRYMARAYPELSFHLAKNVLRRISDLPTHEFWPDNYDCLSLPAKGILSHNHLTDAYLVSLAQARGGRVATLDRRMADVFAPTAFLVS
jgi:predicted nucleic acid-binding protein